MKKYKLKKQVIIIPIILVLIILVICITKTKNSSYSLEYKIDKYNIEENYDDNYKTYYFEIIYNNKKYPFIYNTTRLKQKKLIKDIEYIEEDNIECINIKSDLFNTRPICYEDDELKSFNMIDLEEINNYKKDISTLDENIDNYTLYNNDNTLLIWNYKGFNYIKNNKIQEIKIFNKDIYNIPFYMKLNNYILIPDYEQEYTFNKIYILNLDNNKVSTWKLDYDISFNSINIGTNDRSIFILDKQNKIEYELVPHKQKMRIVGSNKNGIIYEYGKSKKVSITSILNESSIFKYYNIYNYEIDNNQLYLSFIDRKTKYLITDKKVSKIEYTKDNSVYYIVDDILYGYNPKDGEYKILKYNEFKYNKNIPIIIN